MPVNNGYKICYKENGGKEYHRFFITPTYNQALSMLFYYRRYPQNSREDRHKLKKPKWFILPISNKEIKAGIWNEDPFPTSSFFPSLAVTLSRARLLRQGKKIRLKPLKRLPLNINYSNATINAISHEYYVLNVVFFSLPCRLVAPVIDGFCRRAKIKNIRSY